MQSTNIREIKSAIRNQTFSGRASVRCAYGRVFDARSRKGQLQVKVSTGSWISVSVVNID